MRPVKWRRNGQTFEGFLLQFLVVGNSVMAVVQNQDTKGVHTIPAEDIKFMD